MEIAIYTARFDDDEVQDYTINSATDLFLLVKEKGKVVFEYDEEAQVISAMIPCPACEEIDCECDDEGEDTEEEDEGEDTEEEDEE